MSAIASLCRKLEIGHFFGDGNQRTIVFVILNKLLIENDFTPVILEDPIVFDGYHSKQELIDDINVGMENFLLCASRNSSKEKISTSQINSNVNMKYPLFFNVEHSTTKEIDSDDASKGCRPAKKAKK